MTIKVRETWIEIVERENIIEVDSLEEAWNKEINLEEGELVSIELDTNSIGYEVIEEVSDE
tara:strand:+ start:133 stop:315 length:183 start_codon:yes stop_codon:yes gene_type:complete